LKAQHIYYYLLLLSCLGSLQSYAAPIDADKRPLDRPALPEFSPSQKAHILPPLPELPPLPVAQQQLSTVAKIVIKKFEFTGNKEIDSSTLRDVVASYTGRSISAEQLQTAKDLITRHYIKQGYINSGAVLPDQTVADGTVLIKIIEGQLSQINISDNEKVATDYIQNRLQYPDDKALNITELQKRLQLLHQNPLFKRINAQLAPGVNLGEGILNVKIKEEKLYGFDIAVNNHRSPSIGSYRTEAAVWHNSLFGRGDRIYARYGITEGLNDYSFHYRFPLNRYDTQLNFFIERSDSDIVAEPFKQLDIASITDTYAISLTHPVYKTPNQALTLGLKLEKRRSETTLRGRPYPFSGSLDGISRLTVLRFSQDWLDRSRTQVIAARSSFNIGLDALGSTIAEDDLPDSRFFSWLGQFQWVRRLQTWDSQLLFRTDIQWADQSLLSLERFSIGGASTVRGYRENQLTQDKGVTASLEWRIPLPYKLPLFAEVGDRQAGTLIIAPFIDYGRVWAHNDVGNNDIKELSSIGLGLRWQANKRTHLSLYWGKALRTLPEPADKDLQDDGIHFALNIQL